MGLSNESGNFSCYLNSHRFFQSEVLKLYFPTRDPWVAWSVSVPICSSWFICMQMWDYPLYQLPLCPGLELLPCPSWSSCCHLTVSPLCPSPTNSFTVQQPALSRPREHLRLCPFMRQAHQDKKNGPNERTDQSSRKSKTKQ